MFFWCFYRIEKCCIGNKLVNTLFRLEFYIYRSSHSEMFLEKGVLKICIKFTGEHPCRSAISIKLQSNFIEITLRHGCSPVNLLHIFGTLFLKNTSGWLFLHIVVPTKFTRVSIKEYNKNSDKNVSHHDWIFNYIGYTKPTLAMWVLDNVRSIITVSWLYLFFECL